MPGVRGFLIAPELFVTRNVHLHSYGVQPHDVFVTSYVHLHSNGAVRNQLGTRVQLCTRHSYGAAHIPSKCIVLKIYFEVLV